MISPSQIPHLHLHHNPTEFDQPAATGILSILLYIFGRQQDPSGFWSLIASCHRGPKGLGITNNASLYVCNQHIGNVLHTKSSCHMWEIFRQYPFLKLFGGFTCFIHLLSHLHPLRCFAETLSLVVTIDMHISSLKLLSIPCIHFSELQKAFHELLW